MPAATERKFHFDNSNAMGQMSPGLRADQLALNVERAWSKRLHPSVRLSEHDLAALRQLVEDACLDMHDLAKADQPTEAP